MAQANLSFVPMVTAKPPTRQKLHNQAEQLRYIQLWQASELSKTQFCQQHSLNAKTFYQWIARAKLICVNALPQKHEAQKSSLHQIEIKLPSGIGCTFSKSLELNSIIDLLRGLCHEV